MDTTTKATTPLLRIADGIDRLNGAIGRAVTWLVPVMVLIAAFNAVARYLGRYIGVSLSSNMYLELQWYLFSLLFLLAAPYVLRQDAHVRVDVLYARVSPRAQAWIDTVGALVLLIPFTVFTLWVSLPAVRNSWRIREVSSDPGGLARYPLKTMLLVCFALLLLQGIAQLIRSIHTLRRAPR